MNPSLEALLFNPHAEHELVTGLLLPDLRRLAEVEPLGTFSAPFPRLFPFALTTLADWLGNPHRQQTSRSRRGPVPNTLPWLINSGEPEEEPPAHDFSALCDRIEALLAAFPADTSLVAWLSLVSLFVADTLIDTVVRHTPKAVADLYFGGNLPVWDSFENRMTSYLCGELTGAKPAAGSATKTAVRHCCTPPVLAVARERLIYREICNRGLL